MIAVNEFKERRRKLLEKMEDFSVAVIFAGASKIQSEDETCPYLATRNFYRMIAFTHIEIDEKRSERSHGNPSFLLVS